MYSGGVLAANLLRAVAAPAGIEHVGTAISGFDGGESDNVLSLASLSGGSGTAPAEGDLIIVISSSAVASNIDLNVAGYTGLGSIYSADTRSVKIAAYYKFAGASETSASLSPSQNTSYGSVGAAMVFRGVDPDTPFDLETLLAAGNNTIYADPPAVTPVTTESVVVSAGAAAVAGGAAPFASSNLDSFVSVAHDETVDAVLGVGLKEGVVGSFDPAVFTGGGADSTLNAWAAVTLVLRAGGIAHTPQPDKVQRISAAALVRPTANRDHVSRVSAAAFLKPAP